MAAHGEPDPRQGHPVEYDVIPHRHTSSSTYTAQAAHAAENIGNVLLRAALLAFHFTRTPDAVANLRSVQFIPMLSVLIVGAHWP